jgi:hypothetical protein
MSTNHDNFNLWYADILDGLYHNGDAGFAILIIALPLLERYLREKSGVHEGNLDSNFYSELRMVFPALKDEATAQEFWHVYRNGLLHQVTLSQKNKRGVSMPEAWLSSKVAAVEIGQNGDFWVHPAKFAKLVVSTIKRDFTIFEGESSPNHPLPEFCPITDGTGCAQLDDPPATGVFNL